MPKVITLRPLIFTNDKDKHQNDGLKSFKCKNCDQICIITDAELYNIPKRKTDNAVILNLAQDMIKMRTEEKPDKVKIKREKGCEKQWQHACSRCGTVVAYQCQPHNEDAKCMYCITDRLSIPWKQMKTPWVCKICQYMARDKAGLVAHQKQRQHFWQEDKEEETIGEHKGGAIGW